MMDVSNIRKELAEAARRLYQRGLTTVSGGNISARSGSGSILITRSGPDKGTFTGEDICEISPDGENLSPGQAPSMECGMHLSLYRTRPDVNSVIHAHPPTAVAFSASGRDIDTTLTGESYLLLGRIERVPAAVMGSEELARSAGEAAAHSDVILIDNHGPVCLGESITEAYGRIELLEQAARVTLITSLLENRRPLPDEILREIDSIFGKSGG
jgi:L-fuculose-phosphate aldolase